MQKLDHDSCPHYPDGIGGEIAKSSCDQCRNQVLLPFRVIFTPAPLFSSFINWKKKRVKERYRFDIDFVAFISKKHTWIKPLEPFLLPNHLHCVAKVIIPVLMVGRTLNYQCLTITLSLVLAISSGLHTVTDMIPAINPDTKSLNLYLCLGVH